MASLGSTNQTQALTPAEIAQKKAAQPPGGSGLQTIGTAAPAGQQTNNGTPAASNQQQGSGRFTNIQKYLGANQKGAQNITNQIGSNVQKQFDKNSGQASGYYDKLGQSIKSADQTAQVGAGYRQQLGDIGKQIEAAKTAGYDQRDAQGQNLNSVQAFTEQPDFNKFQDFQAGRAIDENLLSLQQQRALQSAQGAAQGSNEARQSLGTEGGRFNLLRNTFGGDARVGYNQGQQRLDQLLFGQGGGVGQLQNLASKQYQADTQLANKAANEATNVSRLANQEKGLISDINTQAGTNEQLYTDMLDSYVDPLNKKRQADYADVDRAVQTYRPGADGNVKPWESGFTDRQMERFGLTDSNQGVYNVFNNDVTSAADIATYGGDASSGSQLANASDISRYNALAKIRGTDPILKDVGQFREDNAWDVKTGEAGLKERLAAAQKEFEKQQVGGSSGQQWYQHGGSTGNRTVVMNQNANANDLIKRGRAAFNTGGNTEKIYDAMGNEQSKYTGVDDFKNAGDGKYALSQQISRENAIKNLSNLLKDQNYARTLGGRRETFLDTESGIPTNKGAPVTGYDPSKIGTK